MKKKTKWIIGGVVGILILGAIGGGTSSEQDTSSPQESSQTATVVESEEVKNVLMEANLHKAPVMNGLGDTKIGEYAYIEIEKDELIAVSQDEFKEFVDEVVKDSGYNYVTIIATDTGEAIFFPASVTQMAQFGTLNKDGNLKYIKGDIELQDDGTYLYTTR